MYFKVSYRQDPATLRLIGYYRLVESYRNADNRVCHRTILNVGFLDIVKPEQLNKIQKELTNRAEGISQLFDTVDDEVVTRLVEDFWSRIVSEKRIDLPEKVREQRKRFIDVETIKHKDVREIGSEWLCYQALEQLQLGEFLETLDWDKEQIQLTFTQIISRAVYPASELRTTRWIKENSAVCELTQYPVSRMTKDKLYTNALELFSIKDKLENHLSKRTNELFDIDDKIIIYDLTNTYFEGEKRNSTLAKYGRSKEKRNDAKLIVLALVINPQGFLKYSNVFEGNTTDSKSLPTIVDHLRVKTSNSSEKAIVVLDAGIATDENLKILESKGYDYVCVSRSKLKTYKISEGTGPQIVTTQNQQKLTLQCVNSENKKDYYLKVDSPGKKLKETGMMNQFESRFEEELTKIEKGLSKKHCTKKAEVINQRIGRAQQKYPSVSKYYKIDIESNDEGNVMGIKWDKSTGHHQKIENLGVYFIRTNIHAENEEAIWKIYNIIREIESTFRSLKTDLDLRPIYHKNDNATLAHLHLGLLGYWVANTIRYQLKQKGISHSWQEITRIGNTQKLVTTSGKNQIDEIISVQRCSEPIESLKPIYEALGYKTHPFVKRKSVVHNPELKKVESLISSASPPG